MPGQILIIFLLFGAYSIVLASPLSPGRFHILNNSSNTAAHSNETNAYDFVFGTKGPRDQLLLRTTIFKKPKIWNNYASKELTFPPINSPVHLVVAQVRTQDFGNGTGGFVKIIKGGIGAENVTILFNSYKNKPIHLGLEIYGHRKNN